MEELQEAEVMWPSYNYHHLKPDKPESAARSFVLRRETEPIKIPAGRRRGVDEAEEEAGREDEEESGGMVPPHVVIERRSAGKMTFSVCSGNGRTLKGRDLSRLRNSVLRMTGFLEG